MKKTKRFVTAVAGFFTPMVALAAAGGTIPVGPTTIELFWADTVCPVSNWFFTFILLAAVVSLLLSAWYFLRSKGSEQELETAKKYVRWALIGTAVAILAKTLVIVLGNVLGIDIAGFLC